MRLINRMTRSVSPAAAGEVLLVRFEPLLDEVRFGAEIHFGEISGARYDCNKN